jgi:hypothetical protein
MFGEQDDFTSITIDFQAFKKNKNLAICLKMNNCFEKIGHYFLHPSQDENM